jgi:hypothetical protein
MKAAQKSEPRNMGTDGKTRPTSTQGIASPRATEGQVKEVQGIIQGDAKKAGEGVIQDNKAG